MRLPSLVKRLAVMTGISAALTAWRNVMLSINERETEAGGSTPDTSQRAGSDITLPPK